MLHKIKKIIPLRVFKKIQPIYHYAVANMAAFVYGNPSKKLKVIGVTGTAGKSSTAYFISQILEAGKIKNGLTTTTINKIGEKEWLNKSKMTMPGRFQLQKTLKKMLNEDCKVAIIETSSQGIEQFRHIKIHYDILVFTNLYPEHIEAHGSFEKYKQAKGKLFKYLSQTQKKEIEKTFIINLDDEHSEYFLNFKADKKIGLTNGANKMGDNYQLDKTYSTQNIKTNLLGKFNLYNALSAKIVGEIFKVNQNIIEKKLNSLRPLPGRLEFIENNLGINVVVDYAFEPQALKKTFKTLKEAGYRNFIHVVGSTGGGKDPATQRDKSRRPVLGQISATNSIVTIVTNEDPYDEDPKTIIKEVTQGAIEIKEKDGLQTEIKKVIDRRQAIKNALLTALELKQKTGQKYTVLITGKGAEQAMCVANGKMIEWDDRSVIREEVEKIN